MEGKIWGYTGACGPDYWGDLAPEFVACKEGQCQSPVAIDNARSVDGPELEFHYSDCPLDLINTRHFLMARIKGDNALVIDGKRLTMQQFHFHIPAEHPIKGRIAPMELHLVHADEAGAFSVVSVMMHEGKSNALFDLLLAHCPRSHAEEYQDPQQMINPANLLPTEYGYYHYGGSLTFPPCTEGVNWYVLKAGITVSAAQIARYGEIFPGNVRPVQPLNGREITSS